MNRSIKIAAVTAVLALGAGSSAALASSAPDAGESDGEPITIGVINSITGPGATAGVPAQAAYDALLERTNAAGGINGHEVNLVVFDDKTDPTEATRGFQELVDKGAVAILGPLTGTAILAVGPLAAQAGTSLVVFAGTQSITDPSPFFDYIFRAAPPDSEYWNANLDVLLADPEIESVAVITEETAYGENALRSIEAGLEDTDVEIVEHVTAPSDAVDVTAQARRIADAEPDAILLGISIGSLALSFVNAAERIGLDAPMFSNPNVTRQSFRDEAGSAADGLIAAAYINGDDPSERALSGPLALAEEAGYESDNFGDVLAGNAWLALAAAIERIDGPVTAESVHESLQSTCGIVGFLEAEGCFTPEDHDGWKADSVVMVQIQADGTLVTL